MFLFEGLAMFAKLSLNNKMSKYCNKTYSHLRDVLLHGFMV